MQSPENMFQLTKAAQSAGQLSQTDISTSRVGVHAKMPSIDSSRSGRLLLSLDQGLFDKPPATPTNRNLNKLIMTGG